MTTLLEREDRGAGYHLFESAYGACERGFALPCVVEGDRASAKDRNGVLTVRIPPAEPARPKRIRVQPGR